MIDEKTIELVDAVIADIGKRIGPLTPVSFTNDELDKIIGPPLTLEEHRLFYRMYLSILGFVYVNGQLKGESFYEDINTARLKMRSPEGLAVLAELLQRQSSLQLLIPLAENVELRTALEKTYLGRKTKQNPFKDAFVEFVQANPDMTLLEVQRARDQWLDDELGRYEKRAFIYYDHKGEERQVGVAALRKWFTEARKSAKNARDT